MKTLRMLMFRRPLGAVWSALMLMGAPMAYAGGVPTISLPEIEQLEKSLNALNEQINQMKQQYAAVTGTYQRGAQLLDDAISAAKSVPGSWQDVVSMQNGGVLGNIKNSYEQIIKTLPVEQFRDKRQGSNYKMATDSVRSALAGSETIFNEAQTHLNNFTQLARQIDSTVNVKDAADLQNRMSAEMGLAQAAQMKLTALTASLTANQLNADNQGVAARQKFLGITRPDGAR